MSNLVIRPVSIREEGIINELERADERTLMIHLGQKLGSLEYGEDPQEAAENWLQTRQRVLHDKICTEGAYCQFIKENRHRSSLEIIAALADLLATAFGGLPFYTLSTLLVRRGLEKFCSCND
jgi:hypothetical protein